MDAAMLSAYQSAMAPEDDLWIIGDFAFAHSNDAGRLKALLAAIPGRKHLIKGNHDKPWMTKLKGWALVHDMVQIIEDGTRLTLCHYPMITWPGSRHGALQLFGHVHDNWAGSRNSIKVGVDLWGFRPVTLPEIKARAASLPINPLWHRVEPNTRL